MYFCSFFTVSQDGPFSCMGLGSLSGGNVTAPHASEAWSPNINPPVSTTTNILRETTRELWPRAQSQSIALHQTHRQIYRIKQVKTPDYLKCMGLIAHPHNGRRQSLPRARSIPDSRLNMHGYIRDILAILPGQRWSGTFYLYSDVNIQVQVRSVDPQEPRNPPINTLVSVRTDLEQLVVTWSSSQGAGWERKRKIPTPCILGRALYTSRSGGKRQMWMAQYLTRHTGFIPVSKKANREWMIGENSGRDAVNYGPILESTATMWPGRLFWAPCGDGNFWGLQDVRLGI